MTTYVWILALDPFNAFHLGLLSSTSLYARIPFVLRQKVEVVFVFFWIGLFETYLICLLSTFSCCTFGGVVFFLFVIEQQGILKLMCVLMVFV